MTTGFDTSESGNEEMRVEQPLVKHDPGRKLWVRGLMQVLWPAFLGAAIAVGILFSLIDPLQIEWVHVNLANSRQASYTLGFLVFWALFTISCGLTWFLASFATPSNKPGDS